MSESVYESIQNIHHMFIAERRERERERERERGREGEGEGEGGGVGEKRKEGGNKGRREGA